jgi:signal transduction histidine kinase
MATEPPKKTRRKVQQPIATSIAPPGGTAGSLPGRRGRAPKFSQHKPTGFIDRHKDSARPAQKFQAIGRLAGGIAHDFNNLLTVIGGRCKLSLRQIRPADPIRRDLEVIDNTAERAAGLTRQLLAFSRKQVLEPRVLDLNAVVAGVAPMLRRLIGEAIELVIALDPAAGHVKADARQLEQVLMNLAINARDAMTNGGQLMPMPVSLTASITCGPGEAPRC